MDASDPLIVDFQRDESPSPSLGELTRTPAPSLSTLSEEAPPLLSPEIRAAIERIDADICRLKLGDDRTKPLVTIYEMLAETRVQGTDIPEALDAAMFGDGYLLSHQRRLLAILVARALPEIERLLTRPVSGNEGSDTPEPTQPAGVRARWVRVSEEMLKILTAGEWSPPLQLKVTRQDGDILEFIGRNPSPPGMTE